jgi:hypothetical protein
MARRPYRFCIHLSNKVGVQGSGPRVANLLVRRPSDWKGRRPPETNRVGRVVVRFVLRDVFIGEWPFPPRRLVPLALKSTGREGAPSVVRQGLRVGRRGPLEMCGPRIRASLTTSLLPNHAALAYPAGPSCPPCGWLSLMCAPS